MKVLIEQFVQTRQELVELINRIPSEKTDVVFGAWDLKCVLAHLTGWDVYFTKGAQLFERGESVPFWGDIDAHNAQSAKNAEGKSWNEVHAEWLTAGDTLIEVYRALDDSLWEAQIWENPPVTPARFLKITVDHYAEHAEKIAHQFGL
jgi:hypothetical protein